MNSHVSRKTTADLAALDAKINDFLPPRYQHCYETVSPESMGSAAIQYDADGKVAWDRIWTTFCDLALAGGPPHRGKLLEPPLETEVAADPQRYHEIVEEIDRAIGLTAGMPVLKGDLPGWVEIPCDSPDSAAWLQYAVSAENVSARRRGDVLLLPAGPAFRPEKEIKNLVVSLSKSIHYWDGHLSDSQQRLAGDSVWEPATPNDAAMNPTALADAVTELEAALRPIGPPLTPRRYAGWVGVETTDPEEAVWLLRAVLVEQVLVRREEHVLFFPVASAPNAEQTARIERAFRTAWELWQAHASQRGDW